MNLSVSSTLKNLARSLTVATVAILFTTGCETYQNQNQTLKYWRRGDLTNAVVEATKQAESHTNSVDAIIWRLEQAAVLRAVGDFRASNEAFDQAQETMEEYAQNAKVSVSREAGALLSNQSTLPYQGRAYDGVMLNTYKALNYLALGEMDKARPEIIRAYQRQQDALAQNRQQIEKAQAELAEQDAANRELVEKQQNSAQLQNHVASLNRQLDQFKAYADYLNPFTVYLDGLFFLANSAGTSDLERARKSFEQLTRLASENEFVREDLALAEDQLNGKPLPPTTYVIFETGCAPIRNQIRIDIPTFWPELPYLGAAFPELLFATNYFSELSITGQGLDKKTATIASLDAVIAQEFKKEFPSIITKTLISTAIKATATHFAWEATRRHRPDGRLDDGGFAGMAVIIGAVIWQSANNIADTRTWTTLPKEFQIARFPTPADRQINLVTGNGQQATVTIPDGTLNLIYVKSINTRSPLLIDRIKLK